MSEPKVIFKQQYHGFESLSDVERDVSEAIDADFNPLMEDIPSEFQGTVTVTITYTPSADDSEDE